MSEKFTSEALFGWQENGKNIYIQKIKAMPYQGQGDADPRYWGRMVRLIGAQTSMIVVTVIFAGILFYLTRNMFYFYYVQSNQVKVRNEIILWYSTDIL